MLQPVEGDDLACQRDAMVRSQIAAKGIKDPRVLEAMRRVPREKFVTAKEVREAYADSPLPIDCGQTVSQPYMVALMSECLELKGSDRVLEIGTGSGYQTAILCLLCDMVYSVEKHATLNVKAKAVLDTLRIHNVRFKVGDGTKGWPEHAPYDGIIVTAGAPEVPAPLVEQLATGGRLVIPVGDSFSQTLKKLVKTDTGFETKDICGCRFVPLVGEYGWQE